MDLEALSLKLQSRRLMTVSPISSDFQLTLEQGSLAEPLYYAYGLTAAPSFCGSVVWA